MKDDDYWDDEQQKIEIWRKRWYFVREIIKVNWLDESR